MKNLEYTKNCVIILAAGIGSRLYPLTLKKPKPLLNVGMYTILDRIIYSFAQNGIRKIYVVVGYKASMIMDHLSKHFPYPKFEIFYVYNHKYNKTNTVYSLWLASSKFSKGTTFIVNGDLLINSETVSRMKKCPTSCLAISKHPCGSEEVKIRLLGNRVISIGKNLNPEDADGEYVGIAKINEEFGRHFSRSLFKVIRNGDLNLYYDDIIDKLLSNFYVKIVDVTDLPVMEIDTFKELEVAVRIYGNK